MLDPWIIEEILRREEERRREDREQPHVEVPNVPHYEPHYEVDKTKPADDETDRGVVVIDI